MSGPSRLGRAGLALLAIGVVAAFLAAAAFRRLNFDELVTVRSGWLLANHLNGLPSSAMPLNFLAGTLASHVEDPGTLFLVLRLFVAGGVLAALLWALRAAGGGAVTVTALIVTLLQATFVVHGLEFRYEAAILVGLLLAFGALCRGGRSAPLLGLLVPFLAAHHLKGIFFGLVVSALALFSLRRERRLTRVFLAAMAAGFVLWIGGAAASGLLPKVAGFYRQFAGVASNAEHWWPWESLGPAFSRDAVWWIAGASALVVTIRVLSSLPPEARLVSPDLFAAVLAVAGLAFLFMHPHPWAYMLAPPAPFFAFLMARRLLEMPARVAAAVAALFALGLALQGSVGQGGPWVAYSASFNAPRAPEVETLRMLKRLARPGEKVIDPSGLAYFLPPCQPEWYVDSIFLPAARVGHWMAGLKDVSPAECPWVVHTYRIDMLPKTAQRHIRAEYLFVRGGLGLPRGDPRLLTTSWPAIPFGPIPSFFGDEPP